MQTEKLMPTNSLNWPLPNCAVCAESELPHPKCTIVLQDATQIHGHLAKFDPDHDQLEILPSNSTSSNNIQLSNVKRIQLDHPVTLTSATIVSESQGIFSTPELSSCTVEFKDGEILNAYTFGLLKIASGIYLYLPDKNKKFIRHFIPTQAIKKYSVGRSEERRV